jgi:transcriptional regulator with XRE-family HTH domain
MITSEQIRAARGLLGWSQAYLARQAGVGLMTIKRMEHNPGRVAGTVDTVLKIQGALETAGIRFINTDKDGGPGVRLSKPK